jgi:hypothetical protein
MIIVVSSNTCVAARLRTTWDLCRILAVSCDRGADLLPQTLQGGGHYRSRSASAYENIWGEDKAQCVTNIFLRPFVPLPCVERGIQDLHPHWPLRSTHISAASRTGRVSQL